MKRIYILYGPWTNRTKIHEFFYCFLIYFFKVQEQLQTLGPAWIAFQQCLIDCDDMLRKSKEKFKAGLLASSEEFKKAVGNLEDEFALRGPISPKIAVNEALAAIKAFNNQVDSLKEQEAKIRRGLNIFKIEQQPSKALQNVEKDIGLLQQVHSFFVFFQINL